MTNNRKDFVGPITKANVRIKGVNGISNTCYIGTVKWSFEDSDGRRHDHIIPGTYYSPDLPCRLLSPQHWAQARNDNSPKKSGTLCETYDDRVILRWSQRRFDLTVPLDRNSNVAYIRTVAGFDKFANYCTLVQDHDIHDSIQCYDSHVIPLDDDPIPTDLPTEGPRVRFSINTPTTEGELPPKAPEGPQRTPEGATLIEFDDLPTAPDLVDRDDLALDSTRDELYRWHLRLGHIPFARLKIMALKGDIPKRLATAHIPMCAACQYGKLTRQPWRTKGEVTITRPSLDPSRTRDNASLWTS